MEIVNVFNTAAKIPTKMEPSKEAIAVRITRLNRQILGKVTSGSTKFTKKTIDREALLDALTALYDECNDNPVKKTDELVRVFVDKCKYKYRSCRAGAAFYIYVTHIAFHGFALKKIKTIIYQIFKAKELKEKTCLAYSAMLI